MIKLKLWLKGERGRAAALAERLDVHPPFITKIANGKKPIPVGKMYQIECFTGGAVTRRDMHPESPELIWPDLAVRELNAQNLPSALAAKAHDATKTEAA
jgi:DNA-binding transcriptional regulator YdaS (Cro superfamily)